jgi:hypothetical protein
VEELFSGFDQEPAAAMNEIMRVSKIPETSSIISQLLQEVMRRLNIIFDSQILSSCDKKKQSDLQALLGGVLRVINPKLSCSAARSVIAQDADQLMNLFLYVFACHNSIVHEEAMLAMGVTTIFVVLGFLPPSNCGGLISEMVIVLVFMGLLTGPASSRLYKMFNGTESKTITLKTAFKFPSIILAVFFFMNAMIWVEESFGAVPFGTMFDLFLLWSGISSMRALDVGSGSDYLTTSFAMMVGPDGRAVGIEHIPELVASSTENFQRSVAAPLLKDGALSFHVVDGRLGYPNAAPYNTIHVGAVAPEIPKALLEQLTHGG